MSVLALHPRARNLAPLETLPLFAWAREASQPKAQLSPFAASLARRRMCSPETAKALCAAFGVEGEVFE